MTKPFCAVLLALAAASWLPFEAAASERAAFEALRSGAVALVRHANAPGVGDPPGMRLGDCATQRNLDERGRAQAARMGQMLRQEGVSVGAVLTSAWCRAVDTAQLAFPGKGRVETAFNSFFDERTRAPAQTADAMRIIDGWRGPGALIIVSHQVNIAALTGVTPASGEAVVVRSEGGRLRTIGRIPF